MLARLRAHLRPHFLLNTLNTISGLAGEDPEEARRLIGALGDLLRDAFDGRQAPREALRPGDPRRLRLWWMPPDHVTGVPGGASGEGCFGW